ncbi:MAG: hypothetical protein ACRBI6_02615 [Acidimicrobiales bacterium]
MSVAGGGEEPDGAVGRDEPYTSPSAEDSDRTVPSSTTLPIVEGQATVRLTFDQEDGSGTGPDRPWPQGRAAIIPKADIDQFWQAITGLTGLTSSYGGEKILGLFAEDGEIYERPEALEEALASAPAIVVASNEVGEAEVVVEAGDYLICGFYSPEPRLVRIINCEDIRVPQDSHVNLYSGDGTVFISRRDP